MVIILLKWDIF